MNNPIEEFHDHVDIIEESYLFLLFLLEIHLYILLNDFDHTFESIFNNFYIKTIQISNLLFRKIILFIIVLKFSQGESSRYWSLGLRRIFDNLVDDLLEEGEPLVLNKLMHILRILQG